MRYFLPLSLDTVGEDIVFSGCLFDAFVHSFVRRCLMNGKSNLDETYSEYWTPTDDLNRFWRSKVKVTAGRRGCEVIHVDASWSPIPSSSDLLTCLYMYSEHGTQRSSGWHSVSAGRTPTNEPRNRPPASSVGWTHRPQHSGQLWPSRGPQSNDGPDGRFSDGLRSLGGFRSGRQRHRGVGRGRGTSGGGDAGSLRTSELPRDEPRHTLSFQRSQRPSYPGVDSGLGRSETESASRWQWRRRTWRIETWTVCSEGWRWDCGLVE